MNPVNPAKTAKGTNPLKRALRVGSRGSRLAKVQVQEIFTLLSSRGIEIPYTLSTFKTQGDKDRKSSLTTNNIDDFFTDTLDQALIDGDIDIAIHSAKDLPKQIRSGLSIFALTASLDDTDAYYGRAQFADLKPGAKIGTSSATRTKGILELNPKLAVSDIRGNIEERVKQVDQGKYDGIIVAACALKRLKLDYLIRDIMPWEPAALQGQLAVVGRSSEKELRAIFSQLDIKKGYGKVTLVGAGPGDPELITVKAIKALRKADCIFYDYLVHKDILGYAPDAETIYVGKRKGEHTLSQQGLSKQLKQKALAGQNVARLKGGDPLIFGRGADEINYLRSFLIDVAVVPGVSSATGIPSGMGIPLTARGISSSVAFLSGHGESERETSVKKLDIPNVDTVVFLMGLTKLKIIVQSLIKAGWEKSTPIIVISKGTRLEERIVSGTLKDIEKKIEQEQLQPPALVIAGKTVNFWQQHKQSDEKILYLGTNPEKYKMLGQIIHHPMIEIAGIPVSDKQIKQLIANLDNFHIILFTSRFAVHHFLAVLRNQRMSADKLKRKDIAVIGQDTAFALEQYDLTAKVIAKEETSEGMLEALKEAYDLEYKNILFPRSSLPNPYLNNELRKRSCLVTELTMYTNVKPPKKELPNLKINKVLFTSPSTVNNFLKDYGTIPKEWQILSKGPRTSESLKEAGYDSEMLVMA